MLLRDIRKGDDPQILAVVDVIAGARPDILALQGVDWDHDRAALKALAGALAEAGLSYPHLLALRPNSGMRTGLDHDGDGRTDGWRDAQGFGRFPGAEGMAILSRHPIDRDGVQDFSDLLWADLPGAVLPERDGALFPSQAVYAIQRLSSVGHWAVPVRVGDTRLTVMTFHATPPVFDGPEDRNGLRNAAEIGLWSLFLDGAIPGADPPDGAFVIMGDANLDPVDGDGRKPAIRALLADPRLQDPRPESAGGRAHADADHRGPPERDTVDWPDGQPGNLRVDYVLPSADLRVLDAGVVWPEGESAASHASRHRLVWVDIALP
ncbi:endonuclease/exonuclease/phosphatase family protein [Actibacterium ureilyticum]|uniref:endonuclease/exonuclease/phosphatase family protein n=1 Tax=Actibacterium ureilyticum TaxID=1590614 RepID=UPI001FE358D3|nr:endonuclease/exonuclease/phosphatase family protein [Actibacterium ureilyticum]